MITPIQTPRQKKLGARMEKFREVCERDRLSPDKMLTPCKKPALVDARYRVWFALWTETDWKLLDMARTVKRHHATVIYGIRKASAELYGTPPKATLAMIREAVNNARGQMEQAA